MSLDTVSNGIPQTASTSTVLGQSTYCSFTHLKDRLFNVLPSKNDMATSFHTKKIEEKFRLLERSQGTQIGMVVDDLNSTLCEFGYSFEVQYVVTDTLSGSEVKYKVIDTTSTQVVNLSVANLTITTAQGTHRNRRRATTLSSSLGSGRASHNPYPHMSSQPSQMNVDKTGPLRRRKYALRQQLGSVGPEQAREYLSKYEEKLKEREGNVEFARQVEALRQHIKLLEQRVAIKTVAGSGASSSEEFAESLLAKPRQLKEEDVLQKMWTEYGFKSQEEYDFAISTLIGIFTRLVKAGQSLINPADVVAEIHKRTSLNIDVNFVVSHSKSVFDEMAQMGSN